MEKHIAKIKEVVTDETYTKSLEEILRLVNELDQVENNLKGHGWKRDQIVSMLERGTKIVSEMQAHINIARSCAELQNMPVNPALRIFEQEGQDFVRELPKLRKRLLPTPS